MNSREGVVVVYKCIKYERHGSSDGKMDCGPAS